jgi:acetyl esterase/lipase
MEAEVTKMEGMTRRNFVGAAGLAAVSPALGGLAPAAQAAQAPIRVESDVVFGRGGDSELKLDIYRPPAGTEKRMAIVHLHGGGFFTGSKESLSERVRPYSERGYVSITSQYRLTGEARWPAQIHDVKAAIRWTRAHADDLGVMPERIGVAGYSAGGHLALFAAGTGGNPEFEGNGGTPGVNSSVVACCAYYPATEIRMGSNGASNGLLPDGSDEAAHVAASPTTYAAANPPTILFHGTEDTTIAPEGSVRFHELLQEAGIASEIHIFSGVPHVFDSNPEFAEAAAQLTDFFIDRYVLNPRTYPPFGGGGGRGA